MVVTTQEWPRTSWIAARSIPFAELLAGTVVPEDVRGDASPPVRQVSRGGTRERGPQRLVADPGAGPVGVPAL